MASKDLPAMRFGACGRLDVKPTGGVPNVVLQTIPRWEERRGGEKGKEASPVFSPGRRPTQPAGRAQKGNPNIKVRAASSAVAQEKVWCVGLTASQPLRHWRAGRLTVGFCQGVGDVASWSVANWQQGV